MEVWDRLARFVLGEKPPAGRLPERVRETLTRQQGQAEILIGWVQFALVTVFGILYAVSPKMGDAVFQPVPGALAAYFLITVARLYFAHRRRLAEWAVMASVVADMVLLMVLIWSFHIQYHQPAAFYLKAPTLLYVFIFIALRALRFEAKHVVATGLVAAAGWAILLWYSIVGEMRAENLVTRDYVQYITSNRILIGAEIDKILSILLVTAVLAVAVARAQRVLHRAVLDSAVARDLSRFVSPEIAERIASSDKSIQAGDGEMKVATVMFTDIEGFSTVSERLDPHALARTLNDYFAALSEAIDRHGGVITMFQGDAMLIAFNTVHPDPAHAANAVRTALAIQEIVNGRTFGQGAVLKTRCGINTGPIVVGAVGAGDRLVFTVHGDEVNVAARLEPLCKQYATYVLVSQATCDAAGPGFAFERMGEVVVKGRAAPTVVYAVRGAVVNT